MTNPHGSFIWYELMTPDPDGAKAFYDAVVGWNIEAEASNPMGYRMIGGPDGFAGGVCPLTEDMVAGGARPGWLGYIGVDDVDASVAGITAAGGSVLMPAHDLPGVGRMAMVADPQGIPFYVMRGASDETSNVFSEKAVGYCSWNELNTTDQAAALDFYTTQFGWTQGDAMDMGPMGEYRFLHHAGLAIGAAMTNPPESGPPHWSYYFRVADIDAAAAQIPASGGTILFGPSEVPGEEYVIIGMDPQGGAFGLVGVKS